MSTDRSGVDSLTCCSEVTDDFSSPGCHLFLIGKLQFSSANRDANSSLFKAQFLDRARIVGNFFFFLYSLCFLYINKNIYVWAWLKIKFIHYSPQEYLQLYNIWLFHLNHFVWINWLKLSTVTQHFFKKNYNFLYNLGWI